jgi:hypothetical protein
VGRGAHRLNRPRAWLKAACATGDLADGAANSLPMFMALLCLLIVGPSDENKRKTKQNSNWYEFFECHGPSPVHVIV